jgi:hypothetical protein
MSAFFVYSAAALFAAYEARVVAIRAEMDRRVDPAIDTVAIERASSRGEALATAPLAGEIPSGSDGPETTADSAPRTGARRSHRTPTAIGRSAAPRVADPMPEAGGR